MPNLRQRPLSNSSNPPTSSPFSNAKSSSSSLSKSNGGLPMMSDSQTDTRTPLLDSADPRALSGLHPSNASLLNSPAPRDAEEMENSSKKSQWIVLAIASGGCAAFNGVFAKLTTTELTTTFATWIAHIIGLDSVEGGVEVVVRVLFFALNLIFNGIMWTLFTKALARGTSTTQVSILNTSANFMLTAVLGWAIFSESLPPLWFAGAGLLVAGNVIIGRRDEGEEKDKVVAGGEGADGRGSGEEEQDLLGEEVELDDDVETELERKRRREEDDILDLDDSHTGRQEGRLI